MEQFITNLLDKAGFKGIETRNDLKSLVGRTIDISIASLGAPLKVHISAAYLTTDGSVYIDTWSTDPRNRDVRLIRIHKDKRVICVNSIKDAPADGQTPFAETDHFKMAA